MPVLGDILVYRGVEPVPGRIVAYEVDSLGRWMIAVELSRKVASIYRVNVNDKPSQNVEFLGSRQVIFEVPSQMRRSSLQVFLSTAKIQVLADVKLRDLGTSPDSKQTVSVSIGLGIAPKVSDDMDEAVQRCIRFLMMSEDVLNRDRGGGLLQMRRRGLMPENVALRYVSSACTKYNRFRSSRRRTTGWRVLSVVPLKVHYTTWEDAQSSLGLIPLSGVDFSGIPGGDQDADEKVLSIALRMTVARGDAETTLSSAVSL